MWLATRWLHGGGLWCITNIKQKLPPKLTNDCLLLFNLPRPPPPSSSGMQDKTAKLKSLVCIGFRLYDLSDVFSPCILFSAPFSCCQHHTMQRESRSPDTLCALLCRASFDHADCLIGDCVASLNGRSSAGIDQVDHFTASIRVFYEWVDESNIPLEQGKAVDVPVPEVSSHTVPPPPSLSLLPRMPH